eukprot:3412631-Rhodomonas_salina.1
MGSDINIRRQDHGQEQDQESADAASLQELEYRGVRPKKQSSVSFPSKWKRQTGASERAS